MPDSICHIYDTLRNQGQTECTNIVVIMIWLKNGSTRLFPTTVYFQSMSFQSLRSHGRSWSYYLCGWKPTFPFWCEIQRQPAACRRQQFVTSVVLGLQRESHSDSPALHGQAGVSRHHEALALQTSSGVCAVPQADSPYGHRHPHVLCCWCGSSEVSLPSCWCPVTFAVESTLLPLNHSSPIVNHRACLSRTLLEYNTPILQVFLLVWNVTPSMNAGSL